MSDRRLTLRGGVWGTVAMLAGALLARSPPAGAQPAPGEIINRARLQYVDLRLGQTNTFASDPVRVLVQETNALAPKLHFYQDATFSAPVAATLIGRDLFVQAEAPVCNLQPTVVEMHRVLLTSTRTGDRESFLAVETAPGSGRFRIEPAVPTRNANFSTVTPGNGIMETVRNDILSAAMDGCGAAGAVTTVLVDPGGLVFNSRNNAPVAGATVTLWDEGNGLRAEVFQADGSTPAPNPVVTGPEGIYVFAAVRPGVYRLAVEPPPGFTAPSQAPLNALPVGRAVHNPGSFGGQFPVSLATGPVSVDVPVDPLMDAASGLFIQKTASRATAEIGDLVLYEIQVRNVSDGPVSGVRVTDRLPAGFAYQKGSTRFGQARVADPAGGAGPELEFLAGDLAMGLTLKLSYVVRVGPGALQGDGRNQAQAASPGPPSRVSNVAVAKVKVEGGVFDDRGVLIGRVFVDLNGNRIQDAGEPGVPGVRIWMEDGTYAITDGEGQYNLYGISPRLHVLKVDPITLPPGARLVPLNTRNAGSAGTRFLDLKRSELHKANFALAAGDAALLEEIEARRAQAAGGARELAAALNTSLTRDGVPLLTGDPKSLPASGRIGGPDAGAPTVAAGPATKPAAGDPFSIAGSATTEPVRAEASGRPEPPQPPPPEAPNRPAVGHQFTPVLPPNTLDAENSNLPGQRALPPSVPLEQVLTNVDHTPGFLDLQDGDTLPFPQADVRVKGRRGAAFQLAVNGTEIPASRVSRRADLPEQKLAAWEFVGVPFAPGTNTLTVRQVDGFGNVRGEHSIRVVAPDKLGRIRLVLPATDQAADGATPARIGVLLEDRHGVPVTARTPLTLEASLGEWQVPDLNPREPGVQVFVEGGRGEFALLPPLEPGEARLIVSSGALQAEAVLPFLPNLRPLMAVGLIQGQVNLNQLGRGSILPARSNDGFEEELRSFAASADDGRQTAAGRAAFFLKGKIKGEYLLTAAYDSERDTRERLFRDIQPDEYYPVYGDDSVKGFDAQSTERFYVRVDKRKCYLLYGDFSTQEAQEARGLGNYSRSLTGIKEHYEKNRLKLNVWASQDTTRQVIEEIPANGTSGPYFFNVPNGILNSEQVEILVRDRHQPAVILEARPQTRFLDYEFEPFTGRILFRAPVPSLDAHLNPLTIRVTYEVDQGGDAFWVYGGDAQVKLTRRWEIGGSGVADENPLGHYDLYSANTTYQLAERTFLLGEVARSDSAGVTGDAGRVELRHQGQRTDLRLYYGRTENTFSNNASVLAPGRIEAGVKVTQRLTRSTRATVEAIDTESVGQFSGNRRGVLAAVEKTFTNQVRVEIGGRYSTESAIPASPSTAVPPGLTPNEVTSLRTKITLPVPKVRNATIYGEYENDVLEPENRLVAFGGEYQVHPKTRLYARHEFLDSIGGPFELNNFQRQNTTVVGIDTEYMRQGQLFNEYRMRDALSGREGEAATGLRNQWQLAQGLRLQTGFERVTPVLGDTRTEATALTAGIEYTRKPDWKGTARIELRAAEANDSLLNTFGYARKLSRDWTLLSRTILYLVENHAPAGRDKVQGRLQAGLAWRQTYVDRWSGLMKYEFKIEDGDFQSNFDLRRRVHLWSFAGHYQPHADWLLSGHYAGKVAVEDGWEGSGVYDAHLVTLRAIYDLTRRWDVGLKASALFDGNLRSAQYGIGPEIGFTVRDNLRIGVGYNVLGFTDRDLGAQDYTQRGVYIALMLKFDETSLGFGRKDSQKQ